MKHFANRFDTPRISLLRYFILLQAMRKILAEELLVCWMLALCTNTHDESPASNAYARLEHLQSSSERQRGMSGKRSAESGFANGVPSEKNKSGKTFEYVTNILYDEYGQRSSISYGNGTSTKYKYDPARRWLDSILTINKYGEMYQNIAYDFDNVGNVSAYTNDCLGNRKGNYKTAQKYEYDALYQLVKASGETTYNPYHSMNAEHVSKYEQVFEFDTLGLGNMTSKVSSESVRPSGARLGDDLNYSFQYEYDTDFAHRLKRAGNRWYKYDSNGNVIFEKDLPEGMTLEDDENTVTMSRVQTIRENVYAIDEGWGLFATDSASAGSSRASKKNGGRSYTWNERNQLVATVDDSRSTSYVYDYNGVRTNKYSSGTETLYFNQFYSMRFDAGVGYGNGQMVKHIYLGDTRIVTKLGSLKNDSYSEEYHKQYFYHSDHLGSTSLISDFEGREYQRIEYTPYGETWVEKSSNTGMEYLPYKFTGKERDEETGLYYFGARYLDPQYSRWLSTDPALKDYIGSESSNGGLYNHINLNLYNYGNNNPITYKDPDGRIADTAWDLFSLATGVVSFIDNVRKGDVKGAAIDALGIIADATAVALPFIPGGCSQAIKATRIVGAAANIASGTMSIQDGLENGNYLEAGLGALQVASGVGQLSNALPKGVSGADTKKINGMDVIQDNSIINPDLLDSRGRTNAERMSKGLAPIGPDGKSVNLHHVNQSPNGPIKEITATQHQKNYSTLHPNKNAPSKINRADFDNWRREYWKQRADDF